MVWIVAGVSTIEVGLEATAAALREDEASAAVYGVGAVLVFLAGALLEKLKFLQVD